MSRSILPPHRAAQNCRIFGAQTDEQLVRHRQPIDLLVFLCGTGLAIFSIRDEDAGTLVLGTVTLALVSGGLMAAPSSPEDIGPVREAAWLGHLRAMDRALEGQDVRGAEQAWYEAYRVALGVWEWDAMAEIADAYVRLGHASGRWPSAMTKARNLYLAAYFRARQQRSVDGLLRTAEAFARLGDRAAAGQALQSAESVAAEVGDPRTTARVQAVALRLAGVPPVMPEVGR